MEKSKLLREKFFYVRKIVIKNGELIMRIIKSVVVVGGSSRNGYFDLEINGRYLVIVFDDFCC